MDLLLVSTMDEEDGEAEGDFCKPEMFLVAVKGDGAPPFWQHCLHA